MSLVQAGDRMLVVDRKLFNDDNTRLFIGVVENHDGEVVRLRGYAYHINPYEVTGTERRAEERVRVVSLSAGDIVYVLPHEVDIATLQVRRSPKQLLLTDGKSLMFDLSEWLYRV